MSRQVRHDGQGTFQIRFAFDRRLVDLVKTLPRRRWNADERFWSSPEGDVIEVVELLQPEGFIFDDATREMYAACGGRLPLDARPEPTSEAAAGSGSSPQRGLFDTVAPAAEAPTAGRSADDDYTVSALNERVRDVLLSAFPAPIWVVGEISGFNKAAHRRHVGFHLVERGPDGKALSEVNATLFETTRQEIDRALVAAGNPFRLEDEVTVRMRVRVELHVPWGAYRIVVDELDVNYTLGEAARRREEILRRLSAAGLLERNTALPFPALPLRVGLITSLGSDAFNDVRRTLEDSGFAFHITAHGARVQGHATEPSVLNALDWLRERAAELDVVLICRGGGSRTDLAWFDSEALGRAVARFPLPVVVGIGHEQDRSVLDDVGWRAKTPTAAAALLVQTVRAALQRIDDTIHRILQHSGRQTVEERNRARERAARLARSVRALVDRERSELTGRRDRVVRGARVALDASSRELARLSAAIPRGASVRLGRALTETQTAMRQLVQGARRELGAARRRIEALVITLGPASLRRIGLETERTAARRRRAELASPRRVVERGYAILRSRDGKVLTDPDAAPPGAPVRAELRGGTLRLTSAGRETGETREET